MTIANGQVKALYDGDGSNADFAIPFDFQDVSEIVVYKRDNSVDPATVTLMVEGSGDDYTLTGGTVDAPTTVTFNASFIPTTDEQILIIRSTEMSQLADYEQNDGFPAEMHELALDKIVQMVQELHEEIERAILLPLTSELDDLEYPDPIAYGYLRWNTDADGLENDPLVATAPLEFDPATSTFSMTEADRSGTDGWISSATLDDIYTTLEGLAAAGAAYVIYGTYAAPEAIVAGTGISASADQRQLRYIEGSGGAVDVSVNPQIAAGTIDGQEMRLTGTDDTNTVLLEHGNGLILNGSWIGRAGSVLDLFWSAGAAAWIETGRNSI